MPPICREHVASGTLSFSHICLLHQEFGAYLMGTGPHRHTQATLSRAMSTAAWEEGVAWETTAAGEESVAPPESRDAHGAPRKSSGTVSAAERYRQQRAAVARRPPWEQSPPPSWSSDDLAAATGNRRRAPSSKASSRASSEADLQQMESLEMLKQMKREEKRLMQLVEHERSSLTRASMSFGEYLRGCLK